MPVIVSVTKHSSESFYEFRLNRSIIGLQDPEYQERQDAFCSALQDCGLVRLGFNYSHDGSHTVSGYMTDDSSSKYIRIIDVIKDHITPRAKEVLSTFAIAA